MGSGKTRNDGSGNKKLMEMEKENENKQCKLVQLYFVQNIVKCAIPISIALCRCIVDTVKFMHIGQCYIASDMDLHSHH